MPNGTEYLERCTSLAVFGGTFDPIHNGHISVAEAVLNQLKPQKILFMPTGVPPHKPDAKITDSLHRYNMIIQSICATPGFEVSMLEANREGTSYTIDTIKSLRNICPKDCIIHLVVGQDALEDMPNWKDAHKLFKLCQIAAIMRPRCDQEIFSATCKRYTKEFGAIVHQVNATRLDISGTYIRAHFGLGESVSTLMPREAEDYARKHGLYDTVMPDLSAAHFKWVKSLLEALLSPKRFKHSLGVVIEAEKLAAHYGADIRKARWAALLHDCTKEYAANKKRILCERWNIPIDPIAEEHIDLAHGLLGAEAAKRYYKVEDNEVLQAIRFHIMGHGEMTLLDKIIVLADFIEPYREDYYPLAEMRELAYVDIDKALVLGITAMRDITATKGKLMHHWSEDAINMLGGK